MRFKFNSIFRRSSDETFQSKSELQKELNDIKENMIHGQSLLSISSWTYFIEEDEIFFSDEIYKMLDLDSQKDEVSFEKINNFIHLDDLVDTKRTIENFLKIENLELNYRIITINGSVKFINEKTKIIFDETNKAIKVIGILQDITNIKLIEQDLELVNKDINLHKDIEGFGNWRYDTLKKEYSWSEETYNIHGIDPSEFKKDYKNFIKLIHVEDRLEIEEKLKSALEGKPFKIEYRVYQKDGSMKYVKSYVEPLFNQEGQVIALLGSIRDITHRKELKRVIESKNEEIHSVETRFEKIIKESKEGFEIIDSNGLINYSSGSSEKITGYSREDIINHSIYDFFEGEELEAIKNMVKMVLENPKKSMESNISFKTKEGKDISLEIYMTNLLSESSVKGIVVSFRDISEKVKIQKKMIYDANYDKITGLQKRDYFLEQLKRIKEEARINKQRYALLMIDIGGFTHINFSLGHSVGNKLIVRIIERLNTIFKDNKYISRYSEDHFAVIYKEAENDYETLAEDTIKLFSKPFKIDSYELIVTVNIGICIFPKLKEDRLPLKNSAKIALLRSKKQGKNTYKFYSQELNIRYFKEFTLRSDLNKAIEKNELEVYYQPIINLKTNEITGAEALIRWNHPEWGIVPLGEFISVAEETELIIDVGRWVLKEVCRDYRDWQENKLPNIRVGVNFSAIQFFERDLVKNIKEIIDSFKLEPGFLTVEITESVLLKNKEKVLDDIRDLQDIGIEIALDDFGTGFSSLSYLSSLNIDTLKIDKSFIKGLPLDKVNSAIARATIKLAKELNIKVVAEGVETRDQLSYLQSLNCMTGQGYLYSKAKPVEEFEKILRKRKCKPNISPNFYKGDKDRRKFFRIDLYNLLEADLTILKIGGKDVNIGNTKVLIKNIGPGGLCFISNVRFPTERNIILKFTTNLIEKEIVLYGNPVWEERIDGGEEVDDKIYEHGIEFRIDENDRETLVKILNDVQIKMRNNILFAEGSFISGPYNRYFK